MTVAAKWMDCSRCGCIAVLVVADWNGNVLCDDCVAERGPLHVNPLSPENTPGQEVTA